MGTVHPHPALFYFAFRDRKLLGEDVRLRKMATALGLSREAKLRLAWILAARTTSVAAVARHFGISRRTLHTWRTRFDAANLLTLEDRSRAPAHVRTWQVTPEEEARILTLKKRYPRWGKAKIQVLYLRAHGATISQWKILSTATLFSPRLAS
jgi:transposase-like protein